MVQGSIERTTYMSLIHRGTIAININVPLSEGYEKNIKYINQSRAAM